MSTVQERGIRGSAEVSLLAGEHALHHEGDLQTARGHFEAAYHQAERAGDGPALARAALGLGGVWVHEHRTAAEAHSIRCRQRLGLSMIDPRSPLALRLRARLSGEEDYRTGRHATILGMLTQARHSGDPVVQAETLSLAHHCVLGPEHGRLRRELAEDLIGQAGRTGRRGDLMMGLMWRTVDMFLAGHPHAERSLDELRALLDEADHLAVGFIVSAVDVMLAIRAGRFAHAEHLAAVSGERGARAGDVDAFGWPSGQVTIIRWYQGRLPELLPGLAELVNSPVLGVLDYSYLAATATAAAAAGERRLALNMLARLRGQDLSALPSSSVWLTTLYGVAEAAHLLGDTDLSAGAYTLLRPYAHLPVITSLGVACLGSAHHPLGVASLTTGDLDRAITHFREAVRANLALGHWPAVALSRWRLGQALALHGEPADRELELAAQEAAELGMELPAPAGGAARRTGKVGCARHGQRWRLTFGTRSVLVDHSVGMGHLATLLDNPGREVRAGDLVAGPVAAEPGAAQPVLDEEAKRAYQQRLTQLRDDIDELESLNDLERATTLRAEHDWLVTELAAAAGLAGRTRAFTGPEERARISVGKAIRRAIARITAADPVIGAELRATVQTGQRCVYRPR
ncbi:hypothetical protein [Nonomuraea typhae]|uniref:hypothetical protein n=1 Tax=Nonomuraea typhae TaxID=2603600 RepID=UPI001FEC66A0|nr:hypothetical protein [Nonomuraea typhae]